MFGDAYQAGESQVNIGISHSSASLVLSQGCKVNTSNDDAYVSSQGTYSTRPNVIRLGTDGAFSYHSREASATTPTDNAVTLTELFKIDRVGNIYQRISARNMYFGASNQLRIGVQSNGDPNIEAVSGNLKIMDGGSTIMQLRSDALEMKQDIYFGTAGKGIVLGNTSNVDANTLDDYEEGSYTPTITFAGTTYTYGASNDYTLRSAHSTSDNNSISYVKIGRMVYLNFAIFWNQNITARYVVSLPFAYRGSAYQMCMTPPFYILGTLGSGSAAFDNYRTTKNTSNAGHANIPLNAASEVYYQFQYEATS